MKIETLQKTIGEMMAQGKGILAADESIPSAGKRLASVDVDSSQENRRQYRELFLNVWEVEKYLSGVIFHDETLRQKSNDGKPYIKLLKEKGVVPGIKVDGGTRAFPGFPDEVLTEGLDGLSDRMIAYRDLGARFAKWRAVIRIGEDLPTRQCIHTNAILLARYARICQEVDIVPMIEPEVLLEGGHSFLESERVTRETLAEVMSQLWHFRVDPSGVILKTSMVLPGKESDEIRSSDEIALATVRVLEEVVPRELGGIVFLSGGQSPEDATLNLNAINTRAKEKGLPWGLTFSYARAIQGPALKIWRGKDENVDQAREVFMKRLSLNALARKGEYAPEMEKGKS